MKNVPDPRCGRKTKHVLAEVLVCLIAGYLAGRCTIRRSLKWCKKHLTWLRQFVPLKNGIASPSTASRMLAGIDEELFQLEFMEWIGEILNAKGKHLIIDGKALRGAASTVKDIRAPQLMNVIEAATGIVLAQFPIADKDCEITAIPELLPLLEIQGSTVTIDAIGTQTGIMEQILEQGGHFVLQVKKNQPQSYEEITQCFEKLKDDFEKIKKDSQYQTQFPELMKTYNETSHMEKNRERYESRWCGACLNTAFITKTKKEWPFVKTVGQIRQYRIPLKRDSEGNDITITSEDYLGRLQETENKSNRILEMGIISDRELTAEELLQMKRRHWTIENGLHHILDDTFREDRSPAKKSRNNLALVRKFAYNILRIAMLSEPCTEIMTELMDTFCDDLSYTEKYVFNGISSFY